MDYLFLGDFFFDYSCSFSMDLDLLYCDLLSDFLVGDVLFSSDRFSAL
jgi:hypothetical protein